MRDLFVLALAGAAGSVSRYALTSWTSRLFGKGFPYGTLLVNVLGSLCLGLLMSLVIGTGLIPRVWRIPLSVGFFGAFTTFSTFSYETVAYIEKGAWSPALINIGANLVLCLGAAWLGLLLGRTVAA